MTTPDRANNTSDREIVIRRTFAAPRSLVFDAYTDPRHIGAWFGPNGFTTTTKRMNVRPGGEWVFVMHGPDGVDYDNRIHYLEVVRPEHLVYDQSGVAIDSPVFFRTTITFTERDGQTELVMSSVFPTAEARDLVVERFGAIEGGHQHLARLAAHVSISPDDPVQVGIPYHFMRRFDAPRALVFRAWTDPQHLARWWGPDGFTTPVCEFVPRPGSRLRLDMRALDGSMMVVTGEVRTVQEPRLLAFTCVMADGAGGVAFEVLHTVRFDEVDGATLVTIESAFLQMNEVGVHWVRDMNVGWTQSLGRLDDAVELLRNGEFPADQEIVSTRLVRAQVDLVYRPWTNPTYLARWWGPKGFRNTFQQFDLRPGGDWRFIMHGPNGTDYPNHSTFVEITPLRRLVFDHRSAPEFRIIASFSERLDGTLITFRMRFVDAQVCANGRSVCVPSNEENFDRLETALAGMT